MGARPAIFRTKRYTTHHPASDSGIAHEGDVELALAGLRQALPVEQLEAALARGAALDLGRVVAAIMAG